jgi:hypothetical protein
VAPQALRSKDSHLTFFLRPLESFCQITAKRFAPFRKKCMPEPQE